MKVWRTPMTCSLEKLIKVIFKTIFKGSGNCPKDKQEMKKRLFKASCEELCKKGKSVVFAPRPSLPPPSSARGTVHWKFLPPRTQPCCPAPRPAAGQRVIFWGRKGFQRFSSCPQLPVVLASAVKNWGLFSSTLWNGGSALGAVHWEHRAPDYRCPSLCGSTPEEATQSIPYASLELYDWEFSCLLSFLLSNIIESLAIIFDNTKFLKLYFKNEVKPIYITFSCFSMSNNNMSQSLHLAIINLKKNSRCLFLLTYH